MTAQKLFSSDSKLRMILDNSPFPIAVVDESDENVFYWSKSAQKLFGHTPKSVTEWYRLAYPDPDYLQDVIARWKPMVEKARSSETAINAGEYRIRCQDGSEKICELWVHFIPGNMIVTLHDITERKRAEKTLRKNEAKLSTILQTSIEGYWLIDLEGRFLDVNDAYLKMSGYQKAELLGMRIPDVEFVETPDETADHLRLVALRGRDHFESIHRRKDGSSFSVEVSVQYQAFDGGNYVVFIRDISDRKRSEAALKEQELLFSAFLENSPAYIFFKDSEIRALRLSKNFEKLLGMPVEDALGKTMDDLFPSDLAKSMIEDDKKILHEGKLISIVEEMDGNFYETTKFPINLGNSSPMLAGFTIDITERYKIAADLKKSEDRFKFLAEHLQEGLWITNSQDEFIFFNKKMEEISGAKAESFLGLNLLKDLPRETIEHFKDFYLKAKETKKIVSYETDVTTPAGKNTIQKGWLIPKVKQGEYEGIVCTIDDITESRKLEQKVKESAEKYSSLFNTMQEGFALHEIICDKRGKPVDYRFLDMNPAFERLTGLNKADVLGQTLLNLLPDTEKEWIDKYGEVALTGKPMSFENYAKPLNRHYQVVAFSPASNQFATIFTDITEYKIAEEKLVKEQYYLEKAQALGRIGTWELDLLNNELIWTDQNYINFGVPLGTSPLTYEIFLDTIHPEDRDYVNREWMAALDGEPYDIEHRVLVDDSIRWVREVADVEFDSSGKAIKAIGFTQDITQQKEAEAKVREKDIQFRKLSVYLPDLIFQFTRKLDGSYHVPIASAGIRNIFGCSPEDVVDDFSPIASVIHPEDAERVVNDIEYSAKHLTNFTCEFRVQLPGKPIQWIFAKSTPEKLADGSITWYGFNANITERKQAEQEIQKNLTSLQETEIELEKALQEARIANTVKDQFIANISHEIRTPLNSVIGFADVLKQRYSDKVREKDVEIFDYITNSSNRLMRTVDSILNLSQLDAGAIKIRPHRQDLNNLVSAVLGEVQQLAAEKALALKFTPIIPPAFVWVDDYCIHQALLNLIENSIKYTFEGQIELLITIHKDKYSLSVKDSGIGISEDFQQRVFEPYTQESEGYTKNFQGIGLGLALTKRYLDLNGVELKLESQKNIGTTFTLTFQKYDGGDHV